MIKLSNFSTTILGFRVASLFQRGHKSCFMPIYKTHPRLQQVPERHLMKAQRLGRNNLKEGLYRHYKGKHYIVFGIVFGVARHSETGDELVAYRQDYGDKALWVRPLAMFTENVEVDGDHLPRFQLVDDETRNAP